MRKCLESLGKQPQVSRVEAPPLTESRGEEELREPVEADLWIWSVEAGKAKSGSSNGASRKSSYVDKIILVSKKLSDIVKGI